ncbi:MAG: hypothetical protein M1813_002153 [Trichoglossum hirsutum]|jgi:8-oxo-dGTP pyrophosphatase MutT (NUDIX family)|nr:MAG: hypothetical protein M1813_002153 [Trichoglossum hirsutum]
MPNPEAPTFHIPEELNSFAVPAESWLNSHQEYQHLVIGALIFGYRRPAAGDSSGDNRQPHLLLIKRSEVDSYPGRWEVPSGSVERTDPTILDAVVREVFEETGLRVSRFVGQVGGEDIRWFTRGVLQVLKLSFEIEVAEVPERLTARSTPQVHGGQSETPNLEDVPVTLDPQEHQAYEWVTKEELEDGYKTGKYTFITHQYRVLLAGFDQHRERPEQTEQELGESA